MSNPISVQGYKKLLDELESLKKERPIVIQAIKEAREEGDLSENAAYDASRERQGMLEARINYIEALLPQLTVIDLSELDGEKVIFGATVHLINVDTEEEREYTLLGQEEADYSRGTISISSPVGRALLGHKVGDEVTVRVPRGLITYEITDIEFRGAGD
ncbi:MAG: transcription elongation factor GreA [Desulfovibrio sp.]|jgi:transcription elongation factor GreA|nr:transcription elongation factor GreA [Mailhella sp.]MBR6906082.1 transcription elongation factor GreA [Selenomonadaceae bacterium]